MIDFEPFSKFFLCRLRISLLHCSTLRKNRLLWRSVKNEKKLHFPLRLNEKIIKQPHLKILQKGAKTLPKTIKFIKKGESAGLLAGKSRENKQLGSITTHLRDGFFKTLRKRMLLQRYKVLKQYVFLNVTYCWSYFAEKPDQDNVESNAEIVSRVETDKRYCLYWQTDFWQKNEPATQYVCQPDYPVSRRILDSAIHSKNALAQAPPPPTTSKMTAPCLADAVAALVRPLTWTTSGSTSLLSCCSSFSSSSFYCC